MNADHKIWIGDSEHGEVGAVWECSCGRSGSAAIWNVDGAAARHVGEGESAVHTSRRPDMDLTETIAPTSDRMA